MGKYIGVIHRVVYLSDEFCVFRLKTADGIVTCTGPKCFTRGEGEHMELEGEVVKHPKYGQQVKITAWKTEPPKGEEAIIAFFEAGLVKGVRKKMAKRIVQALGDNALQVIVEKGPSVLSGIRGIGKAKAEIIYKQIKENMAVQLILSELIRMGLTANLAVKAHKVFGAGAVETLRKNPYELMEIDGIGFATADALARRLGHDEKSMFRAEAALLHVLNQETGKNGHCFLYHSDWIEGTRKILGNIDDDTLRNAAGNLEAYQRVVVTEKGGDIVVYPKRLYFAERAVAEWVGKRLRLATIMVPRINQIIGQYEKAHVHTFPNGLEEEQREAIRKALSSPFFILTGNPGTGKTTVTKAILWCYQKLFPNRRVALAAPTGRAARRMEEVIGHEASTIHRLLDFVPGQGPQYDENNLLPYDYVIVDEVSMMDITLTHLLLRAIGPSTQVLFVGDPDQLPSVGPGNVLNDLLRAGVPSIHLSKIHRQAAQSNIVMNAHRIREGKPTRNGGDFFFVAMDNNLDIQQRLIAAVRKLAAKGYTSNDIQIFTPMKKTEFGTVELNRILQDILNPSGQDKPEIRKGKRLFRAGDKVMQTRNDYEKLVFNGDIGQIVGIDVEDELVTVNFNGKLVEYVSDELLELELAYAITIHKLQGGEYPVVLIPMTTSHYIMLYRNLLYTGVTRARELCGIIGQPKAMGIAIRNVKPVKRNTGLTEELVTEWGAKQRKEEVG